MHHTYSRTCVLAKTGVYTYESETKENVAVRLFSERTSDIVATCVNKREAKRDQDSQPVSKGTISTYPPKTFRQHN